MDFFYLIGLHQIETEMKSQFEYAEEARTTQLETRRRPTATQRTRLAIGAALYRLAEAIDPAAPVPSRQH